MDIQKIRTLLGLSADRPFESGGKTQAYQVYCLSRHVPALCRFVMADLFAV